MAAFVSITATALYVIALLSGLIPAEWIATQVFWLTFLGLSATSVLTAAAAD